MNGVERISCIIFGLAAGIVVLMAIACGIGSVIGLTEFGELRSDTFAGLEIAAAALGLISGIIYHLLVGGLFSNGMSLLSDAIDDIKDVFENRRYEIETAKYEYVRDRLYCEKGKSAEGGPYREFYAKSLKSFALEEEDAAAEAINSMETSAGFSEYCLQNKYLNKKAKFVDDLKTTAHFIGYLLLGLVKGSYVLLLILAPILFFAGLSCLIPMFMNRGVGAYWLLPIFSIIIGATLMIVHGKLNDWYD